MAFTQSGIYELNEKYMLEADIETIKSLCVTNKYVNNICNNYKFWIKKFEHDNLILPMYKLHLYHNKIYINNLF